MKISDNMVKKLSEQANLELESAYLYYQMALDADKAGFIGMSNWMKEQAKEEMEHAERIFEYVMERREHCSLDAIKKPEFKWESPLKTMEAALAHEEFVTESIHKLVDAAVAEKDFPSVSHLEWFVNEQVEEETSCEALVDAFRCAGDDITAVMMIDGHMGKRED